MNEFFDNLTEKVKEDDVKFLLVGLILLLIPIVFFLIIHFRSSKRVTDVTIEMHGVSRQSAFNLTRGSSSASRGGGGGAGGSGGSSGSHSGGGHSSSYSSSHSSSYSSGYTAEDVESTTRYTGKGIDTRSKGLGVKPNIEKIEEQLEAAMARINKTPRDRVYPPNATPEIRQILDAEHDETYLAGLSALDSADRKLAEKMFKDLIANAAGNKFKELYGWGGLMEIYQIEDDKARFKDAFEAYARKAQELRDFYGPMADSIVSAYQLFEQMSRLDSGLVRQALTKYNLENKTNLRYEDIMGAINETKSWYPENLEMSSELKKKLDKKGGS